MTVADPYAALPDTTPTADPYADLPDTSGESDPYASLPDTSGPDQEMLADKDAGLLWQRIVEGRAGQSSSQKLQDLFTQKTGESGGPVGPSSLDIDLGRPASIEQIRHLVRTSRGLPSNLPVEGVGAAASRGFTGGMKRLASGVLASPGLSDSAMEADRIAAETTQPRNIVAGVSGAVPLVAGMAATRGRALPAFAGASTLNPNVAATLARLGPASAIAAEITAASLAQNIQDRTQTPEEAIVNAAIEGLTTRLGGAAEPFIGLLRANPGLAPRVLELLKEGGEEALAGGLQSISSQTLGNQSGPLDIGQAVEEAGTGGAAGLILGGASTGASAVAQSVAERQAQQRALALDALRNLGEGTQPGDGSVASGYNAQRLRELGGRVDPVQVDERTAKLGKDLAPTLGPDDIARFEAARAMEASAANDAEIARQRQVRAIADEAADISADRRAGMESLAQADEAAQRQMEVRSIADGALGNAPAPVGVEQVAEGRAPDVAETPEDRKRFDTLEKLRQETDQRHQVRVSAITARRREGQMGKAQAGQDRAASEAQRAREYADAAQAVAEGKPLPAWSSLSQETPDAQEAQPPGAIAAPGPVPVPGPTDGAGSVEAPPTIEAAPSVEAGKGPRKARVVTVPNGKGYRVVMTDDGRQARFLKPGSQPVAAQDAQVFETAEEAEKAARASLGSRWDVGVADQAKRQQDQEQRDAEMQRAQQEAGDQAVAGAEARAREVLSRSPDATHHDLLREMTDYGFRVDKSQAIPAGAESRGLALRQALAQRGEGIREMFDRIKAEAKPVPPTAAPVVDSPPATTPVVDSETASDTTQTTEEPAPAPAPIAETRPVDEDAAGARKPFTGGTNPAADRGPTPLPLLPGSEKSAITEATNGMSAKDRKAFNEATTQAIRDVAQRLDDGDTNHYRLQKAALSWLRDIGVGHSPRGTPTVEGLRIANEIVDTAGKSHEKRQESRAKERGETTNKEDDGVPFSTEHAALGAGSIMPAKPPADDKGEIKPLRNAIEDLADWIGAALYTRKKAKRSGWLGYYDPASSAVVMKKSTDLNTWSHEISHWMDDRFGILSPFMSDPITGKPDLGSGPLDDELAKFWDLGSKPPGNMSQSAKDNYVRGEGFAEFLRAWIINPEAARIAAPLTAAHVKANVPADVLERLQSFGMDVRRFYHAPALESGKANVRGLGDTGPTLKERIWSSLFPTKGRAADPLQFGFKDWLRVRFTSRLHPLTKAIRYAGKITSRTGTASKAESMIRILAGVNDKVHAIANNGMIKAKWIKDGKIQRAEGVEGGMDWLMGWANTATEATMRKDLRALDVYLVSQSVVEQAENIDKARADLIGAQMEKIEQEHQDRLMLLDEMTKKVQAEGERRKRQIERNAAGRIDDVRTASEKMAEGADTDIAGMIDKGTAKDRPASKARERMAKRGDALTKSVLDLYGAIDATSSAINRETEAKIRQMQQRVDNWYQAKLNQLARVANRMAARDRQRKANLSGQGGGLFPDDAAAQRVLDEVMENPELRARLDEGAKRYRAWAKGVLTYLRDKGKISKESFQQITAKNINYAAMNRVMDDMANPRPIGGGKIGVAKETVHGRKGSVRTIENPMANLMENTAKSVAEADRNEAMLSVVDMLRANRNMHEGDATDLGSIAQQVYAPGDGAVTVFRNGEPEYWKFNEHVEEAIKGITDQYELPPYLTILARTLRTGVTHSPDFAVRNRTRDIYTRLIIGQVSPKTATGWLKRLAKQIPGVNRLDAEQKAIVELSGSAFAGNYMRGKEDWHKQLQKRMGEMRKDRNIIVTGLSSIPRAYMRIIKASEFSGRADEFHGLFNQLRAEGMDEETAAIMAARGTRDLVDFAESGTWVGVASQMVPFLNAAVQGVRAAGIALGRDPKGVVTRWLLFAAMPAIATYALAAAGGDDELEEYTNLPSWRRDLFWNIKTGPDTWLAIPKPFEIGVLGTGAERLVQSAHDASQGRDPTKAFDGAMGSIAGALIPVDERTMMVAFAPLIETFLANKNTFTGKAIIPDHEKRKPVDQREGAKYASRLGKVGQFISGDTIDPRQVDHLVRGIFGSLGGLATSASDIGREDKAGQAERVAMRMTGLLKRGPGDQQSDVQEMIEKEEKAGRGTGKAIQRVAEMKREFYKAGTGAERDAIAKAMREYASGENPRYILDRALSASNKLKGAIDDLEPSARQEFIKAHNDELRIYGALSGISNTVNAMEKSGKREEEIRAKAKAAMDKIRAQPKVEQVLDDQ